MRNLWGKIKALFSRMWHGLTMAGRIIAGLILAAVIGWGIYAGVNSNDDSNSNENAPEVAQVYEPSIGTPLPADNANGPGEVNGAATANSSDSSSDSNSSETVEHQNMMTTNFVAPKSGVDPNEPIKYENSILKFAALLPPQSQVNEQGSRIAFTSNSGVLHFVVSVNPTSENLTDIEAQLRNSPSTSNISTATFLNHKALQFSAKDYGSGVVFISNGNAYYLLGNSQQFGQFKML